MNKKTTISLIILICLTVAATILWHTQNIQKNDVEQEIIKQLSEIKEQNQEIQSIDILYNADGTIDTSNWKTYRNEEYGFEVKHPEGWEATWKYVDECNSIAEGLIISPSYVRSGKYCEGPRVTNGTLSMFHWYSFYFSAVGNPDYDIVKNAGIGSFLVHKNSRNIYDDILVNGDGETCGDIERGGETMIGFQLTDPPKEWREENQIIITCRNKKYAPILKEIFNSIKFIR